MPARRAGAWVAAAHAALTFFAPQLHAQEVDRLQDDLGRIIQTYRWRDAQWGVLVVSLDQRDTLFTLGPDAPMAPASNVKLITSAAALLALGPDFRFQTFVLTDGRVQEGVLRGDLVLYGTGDPGLSDRFYRQKDEVFHLLADQLEARGIHTVTGDLVADASFLPGPLRPPSWDREDLNDHFAAAVSALSYNENVVSFRVVAAEQAGRPPEVRTVPDHSGLDVLNQARTVNGPARPRLAILRDDPMEPIRVEGRITRGSRDVWRQMTVPVPAHFAASAFLAVLRERGIEVRGDIEVVDTPARSVLRRVTAPAIAGRHRARVLARHVSPPLREYLEVVNKRSNNLFSELVFRTIGRARTGYGTAEASERAVLQTLTEAGLAVQDVTLLDGSGLSSGNRVRPATLVALMEALSGSELWPEFWHTLPEAGTRRGLGRMYRTAAAGNLRAKTGTIEGVSALSGVVRSKDGERLAFSILLNNARSTTRAKRVENEIGVRLAQFTRGPGAPVVVAELPPPVIESGEEDGRYRVREGENLSVIAQRYGLTLDDILRVNPRLDPNRIFAGQWLNLPQRAGGGS